MAITTFCTDEDIAIRDGGDYARICPEDQRFASGSDGVIAPMGWTLTSASIGNLAALGILPGQMVLLRQAGIKASNDLLAVDSVATTNLVLRRKGQLSGVGMPPGGAAGLTALTFDVLTLGPQIEDASYDLYRRFGLDDAIAGLRVADLYDPRELRQATVLTVLKRQYLALARTASPEDTYWQKLRAVDNELNATLDRMTVHRQTLAGFTGEGSTVESDTRFSMRLVR